MYDDDQRVTVKAGTRIDGKGMMWDGLCRE